MKMAWHKKNGYVYLFLGVALLAIFFTIFSGSGNGTKEISFSEVVALAERQDVQEIVVRGDDLTIVYLEKSFLLVRNKERVW